MFDVMVKPEPEVRAIFGSEGRTTVWATPNASAATTSAMALDAITDFVLVNRSDFISSSAAFSLMGKPTEGPQVPPPLESLAGLTRGLAGPRRGSVARPSDRVVD